MACTSCKNRNRVPKCTHRFKILPPFKSRKKQKLVNLIMKDQETILARENYGVVADIGESFIGRTLIDKWLGMPRYHAPASLASPVIVMTMDPNFSGVREENSRQAILSTALFYGKRVVRPFFFVTARPRCCRTPTWGSR